MNVYKQSGRAFKSAGLDSAKPFGNFNVFSELQAPSELHPKIYLGHIDPHHHQFIPIFLSTQLPEAADNTTMSNWYAAESRFVGFHTGAIATYIIQNHVHHVQNLVSNRRGLVNYKEYNFNGEVRRAVIVARSLVNPKYVRYPQNYHPRHFRTKFVVLYPVYRVKRLSRVAWTRVACPSLFALSWSTFSEGVFPVTAAPCKKHRALIYTVVSFLLRTWKAADASFTSFFDLDSTSHIVVINRIYFHQIAFFEHVHSFASALTGERIFMEPATEINNSRFPEIAMPCACLKFQWARKSTAFFYPR